MERSWIEWKQAVWEVCYAVILKRIETIESILQSLKESRNNESKSSVGDKYETGRAILHLEEEKNKTQLAEALAAKSILASIKLERINIQVGIGSLVITDTNQYFIAIGIGKVIMEDKVIYAISIDSPIGQVLKNKKAGEEVWFNGRRIFIQTIA